MVEIPAGAGPGTVDDAFFRFVIDMGAPGPDRGKGGKYLLLPPDFEGETPDGYFTFTSRTYNVFVFWRAFLGENRSTDEAVALMEQTRIYPLSKADNPPEMVFPNGSGQRCHLRIGQTEYSGDLTSSTRRTHGEEKYWPAAG